MEALGLALFDAVLYINLDHRLDRKEEILLELKKQEVPASKIHRIEAVFDPLNGHLGCALSHIKALDLALQNGWKNILILEDDCKITRTAQECHAIIDSFFQIADTKWDVFLIGGRIHSFGKPPHPKLKKAYEAHCAHAYAVNSSYFATLKNQYASCVDLLKEELFSSNALPFAIDRQWDALMKKDRWYFIEIFAQQRASWSDIEMQHRDRTLREQFE